MTLDVRGGPGGIEARYDDMLAAQRRLGDCADELREEAERVRPITFDGAVLEAGILCPFEVGQVEAAVASAAWLPGSATWLGLELEAHAWVIENAVSLYREADRRLAELEELLVTAGGMVAGVTVGVGLTVLATSPAGLLLLAAGGAAAYVGKDALLHELGDSLYDHPLLLEALTRAAPGLVQGLSMGLFGGIPALLAGDRWPTTDYEDAVIGLQALAGRFGLLQDVGAPPIGDKVVGPPLSDTLDRNFLHQMWLLEASAVYGKEDPPVPRIVITPVTENGVTSYIVMIPGTEEWGPTHGNNYFDLTSNVQLMSQEQAAIQQAVIEAMSRAGIGPGDPIMLMGHSQGGIIAASIAADRTVQSRYNVQTVVTAGSPIARYDIPEEVSVLSLEHAQDAVPKLDGRDNPDSANWTTITRDLETSDEGLAALGHAHGTTTYADTAAIADEGGYLDDWELRNGNFIPDDGVPDSSITIEIGSPNTGG